MSQTEHGAAINRGDRPLSPHLQVYKPQITSVMSVFHRITGVGNSLGAILVAWWFIAAAVGEGAFDTINGLLTSWVGHLILFGFALSVCYHLCNGIRHLLWDAGYGFELDQVKTTGIVAISAAGLMVLGLMIVGWLN
jgi:succinate dehydrogenase / fumarate reductase cytochrome b subunit